MKSLIRDVLDGDDCAVVTHVVGDLERLTDLLSVTTKHSWTYNKHQNTEVMFKSTKGSTANMPETKINGKVSCYLDIEVSKTRFEYGDKMRSIQNSSPNCIAVWFQVMGSLL